MRKLLFVDIRRFQIEQRRCLQINEPNIIESCQNIDFILSYLLLALSSKLEKKYNFFISIIVCYYYISRCLLSERNLMSFPENMVEQPGGNARQRAKRQCHQLPEPS